MADDLNRKGPEDPTRINVNQPWELDWWSKRLGVSIEEIKRAVKQVGPLVAKVKQHLGIR